MLSFSPQEAHKHLRVGRDAAIPLAEEQVGAANAQFVLPSLPDMHLSTKV